MRTMQELAYVVSSPNTSAVQILCTIRLSRGPFTDNEPQIECEAVLIVASRLDVLSISLRYQLKIREFKIELRVQDRIGGRERKEARKLRSIKRNERMMQKLTS